VKIRNNCIEPGFVEEENRHYNDRENAVITPTQKRGSNSGLEK